MPEDFQLVKMLYLVGKSGIIRPSDLADTSKAPTLLPDGAIIVLLSRNVLLLASFRCGDILPPNVYWCNPNPIRNVRHRHHCWDCQSGMNAYALKSAKLVFGQPSRLFEPGIVALNSNPFVVEILLFLRTRIYMVTESPVILDRPYPSHLDCTTIS